jgi:hypothetical protein
MEGGRRLAGHPAARAGDTLGCQAPGGSAYAAAAMLRDELEYIPQAEGP